MKNGFIILAIVVVVCVGIFWFNRSNDSVSTDQVELVDTNAVDTNAVTVVETNVDAVVIE